MSNTAEEILHCARALIVARGYSGFSYADIAQVVGVRKASIHHHFPNKVDLVRALVARYRDEATAGIAELERRVSDPALLLRAYTGFWETCIADASAPFCVCAMLAGEIPGLPAEVALDVRGHFKSLSGWLTSVFERGAAEGVLVVSGAAQAEAEMFMAVVHGAMLSARAYGSSEVFGVITRSLLSKLILTPDDSSSHGASHRGSARAHPQCSAET